MFVGLHGGYTDTSKYRVAHTDDKAGAQVVDSPCLFLITLQLLYSHCPDHEIFVKSLIPAANRAFQWILRHTASNGLLVEEYFGCWHDSLALTGHVLYRNCLWYQAIRSYAALTEAFQSVDAVCVRSFAAVDLWSLAQSVRIRINEEFWRGNYFGVQPGSDIFVTEGNCFAILFGIATPMQTKQITDFMIQSLVGNGFAIGTRFPRFSTFQVYFPFYLLGVHEYQNGFVWSWVSYLYIIAMVAAGVPEEAHREMRVWLSMLRQQGRMCEVYQSSGDPVRTTFYASERDFSWASGFFLLAQRSLSEGKVPLKFA